MGKGKYTPSDVGERIRLVREDRGLSQGGLAALLPPGQRGARTANYVSNIETGKQDITSSEIVEIARGLHVDPAWILLGDQHESEFVAQMRGMEPMMDERGKRQVLRTAEQQVEEAQRAKAQEDAFDTIASQMLAAGLDPQTIEQVMQRSRRIVQESDDGEAAERHA